MAKLKINERTVEALQLEIDHHKREKVDIRRENDFLRNENSMLRESLRALVEEKTFWSEDAIKSGIVWRLENVLKQIENNG
jgi:FtsZ-binding cell division protein ZapB